MNNLNREIKEGEKVVLKKKLFKPEFQSLDWRTVTVLGGFGMYPNTGGKALFVRFKDGEEVRFQGYDVDVEETEALNNG